MREQLIHYVSLLFAGAKNAEDIQQDAYDDDAEKRRPGLQRF